MNDIRSLIRGAARRLETTSFLRVLHVVALVVASFALALAIADRLPGEAFIAWVWIAPMLAAIGLIVSLVIWSRRRMNELQVAVVVDERLDLREKLSTALHCHDRDDPFAQAAVEDAVTTSRDARTREALRRRFAVAAPRRWWISPLLVAFVVGVLMLPQADLFASDEPVENDQYAAGSQDAQERVKAAVEIIEEKEALKSELNDLLNELTTPGDPEDMLEEPEDREREALKKITELNRHLDDIINGEKGKTAKALEQMMSKLEPTEDKDAKALSEALAKGNFAEAKKALEQMMDKAKAGELNDEQKQQLAKAMEDLGKQLDKLAQQQKQLEDALKKAGLPPQLANDPQALQKAIQQAQNLNQQQKQQLQQMAQAQQAAAKMCQGLGGACQQMAQGLKNGQMGQMMQGGQQMAGQLNDMENLQQLLMQAQAACNQCNGQGQMAGMMAGPDQFGRGMGNRGQGAGGKAPISPTPTGTKVEKENVKVTAGEVISSMQIDGTPVRGESVSRMKAVIEEARKGYDEAQSEEPMPRRYRETLQHYFGNLQEFVKATEARIPAEEKPSSGESSDASGEAGDAETGGGGDAE